MHDILAPARQFSQWKSSVEYAARLAAAIDGSLTAIYSAVTPTDVIDAAPAPLAQEIMEICRDEAAAALGAGSAFAKWAHGYGVKSCTWHVADVAEETAVAAAAKWHDLVVLERPDAPSASHVGEIGRILLGADVPCIIVSPGMVVPAFDSIAIAWNGTVESARALHAALPLLERAGRILLIHGEGGTEWSAPGFSADAAASYLRGHRLNIERCRIDPDPAVAGREILASAARHDARLLVMGAYGRTRLSEWMLGGATRHALQHAHIPLFMRH